MPSPEVRVLPTPAAVAAAAAERVVAAAARTKETFTIALAGGSTPTALYRLLVSKPIDWTRVQVFFGDERCVPPGDPASNYRMACEALLDHVAIPAGNVHRIRGEDPPLVAAATYERELRATTARLDLVLLGMGDNGHTASIFPGLTAVRETERWVVAEEVAEVGMWRVTLTPVAFNAAAEVLFLVAGREKAAMLHRVLDGPRDPAALPAQAIVPLRGPANWLVDAAAAALLAQQ